MQGEDEELGGLREGLHALEVKVDCVSQQLQQVLAALQQVLHLQRGDAGAAAAAAAAAAGLPGLQHPEQQQQQQQQQQIYAAVEQGKGPPRGGSRRITPVEQLPGRAPATSARPEAAAGPDQAAAGGSMPPPSPATSGCSGGGDEAKAKGKG